MVFTLMFNLLKLVMNSELLVNIRELVDMYNDIDDLDGDGKFDEVWEALIADEDLQKAIKRAGTNLVNLAIEVSVAVVRR